MSYSVEHILVYGVMTEDPAIVHLGVLYSSDGDIPDTPLTREIAALDATFGHTLPGDFHFRVHTQGDWAADAFDCAVVGLRIDAAVLNDSAQLQALQAQARPHIAALRSAIPGAASDIQLHHLEQAG